MICTTVAKNKHSIVIISIMGKIWKRIVKQIISLFLSQEFFLFTGTSGKKENGCCLKGVDACWAEETVNVAVVKTEISLPIHL